jgi:hypothetical protein
MSSFLFDSWAWAASFQILHFQRGVHAYIHSEEREFESRDYKIPRKAHAWRNRVGLLHCYCHSAPLCGLVIAKDSYLLYSLLL